MNLRGESWHDITRSCSDRPLVRMGERAQKVPVFLLGMFPLMLTVLRRIIVPSSIIPLKDC